MFKFEIISESLLTEVAIHCHWYSPSMMIQSPEVRQRKIGRVQVRDN